MAHPCPERAALSGAAGEVGAGCRMGCSEAVVGRAEQALEQQAQALDDELPAQAWRCQAAVTRGTVQVGVRRLHSISEQCHRRHKLAHETDHWTTSRRAIFFRL